MSAARDHSRYDELAVGWALYALEPDDEQTFARHLPACERCRTTVRESQETLATLSGAMAGPMPPRRVLDRIHESIGAPAAPTVPAEPRSGQQQHVPAALTGTDRPGAGAATAPPGHPRHRRPAVRPGVRRLRRLASAAAALVVVLAVAVGGTTVIGARHDAQHQRQVAAERTAAINKLVSDSKVATLRDAKSGSTVGYVVNSDGKFEVVTTGFTPSSPTSEYALWSISTSGGTPVLVGTFDVPKSGWDVQPVASVATGTSGLAALAVSREPGRGTPTRPTTVVASGAVNS